ncbi:MAG: hypothetical protein NC311_14935 [Muribaculaceae bacterium]|nr:hypothetical protein [Muribaculaceae bacterium]
MRNNPTVNIIHPQTGEKLELGTVTGPVTISWEDEHTPPIDITTSFQFECRLNPDDYDVELSKPYFDTWQWKEAVRLSGRLNDLVEDYHAPFTPRRERRFLTRQFNKTFMTFLEHCRLAKIDFTFIRTNN